MPFALPTTLAAALERVRSAVRTLRSELHAIDCALAERGTYPCDGREAILTVRVAEMERRAEDVLDVWRSGHLDDNEAVREFAALLPS